MSSTTHNVLIALISAVVTGAPALAYTIWRGRKLGPKEENELVARMAQEAVAAGNEMLTQAREERKEMKEKLAEYIRRADRDGERIEHLEEEVRELRVELATHGASG